MAGAGYTMLHRGHVNVDVLYGRWRPAQGMGRHPRTIFFLFPWLA